MFSQASFTYLSSEGPSTTECEPVGVPENPPLFEATLTRTPKNSAPESTLALQATIALAITPHVSPWECWNTSTREGRLLRKEGAPFVVPAMRSPERLAAYRHILH
jgi:hypothetical protein